MVAFREVDNSRKTIAIGRVIAKHLPKNMSRSFKTFEDPRGLDITFLVEKAIANCAGMINVNGHGYDFIRVINGVETRPESKTSSVRERVNKKRIKVGYCGQICNITRANTDHEKEGDILALIYIPYNDSVKFFYIPKTWWSKNVNSKGQIWYSYFSETNSIPKFKDFECKTFEDLCSPERIGEWEVRNKKLNVLWGAMLDAAIAKDMQKSIRARDEYTKFLLAKAA